MVKKIFHCQIYISYCEHSLILNTYTQQIQGFESELIILKEIMSEETKTSIYILIMRNYENVL